MQKETNHTVSQRYLNVAEQFGVLPLIYTGLSGGLRQCELITLSWADFHICCRHILSVLPGFKLSLRKRNADYIL